MTTVTHIAIAALLCACIAPATARENRATLQCGVQLGGSELAYKPPSSMRRKKLSLQPQFARADSYRRIQRDDSRFNFRFKDNTVSSRLPAIMAIARVGCAWR